MNAIASAFAAARSRGAAEGNGLLAQIRAAVRGHTFEDSGSTANGEKAAASDEKQSSGNNSAPESSILSTEPAVRCAHCAQWTDGDCGEFGCPYSASAKAAHHHNPGTSKQPKACRVQFLSREKSTSTKATP